MVLTLVFHGIACCVALLCSKYCGGKGDVHLFISRLYMATA